MPGIAGIITPGRVQSGPKDVESMVNTMVHESFYVKGTLSVEALGADCGWTMFKGSFADCMPVWNKTRDVCLLFSGEHFSNSEELASLRTRGHDIREQDASWLVHLYEELGPSFFKRLNGWFSGLLLDLREKKVVLFNDRYGVNRIHYHENQNGFYFASEAKALLKVLPETRQFDDQSLGEFISCGCVLQNRTLFRDIHLLPGGSAWVFSPGRGIRKEQYFTPEEWENQPQLTPADFYESLKGVWSKRLPAYMNGREPLALSMTGGVDSRMILASANAQPGTFPCYTFGGIYRECGDVKISRAVARICQQPHETIALDRTFFSEFPALAARSVYITDGTLDLTGTTDLFANRRARQIAPIRMSGLNGGEILRRLLMFKPKAGMSRDLLDPALMKHVEGAADTYASELQGHRLSFTAFKQTPWHMHGRLALERSQVTIRTPYMDNELVALAYQTPPDCLNYNVPLRMIAEAKPSLVKIGTDRGLVLNAVPVFGRLGNLWQEFTFKAEYAYDYGMPQWLAKVDRMLQPFHLERLYLGRHKWHHFRVWYKNELSGFLKEVLLDSTALSRPYLQPSRVKQMISDHTQGRRNYTMEIHRLLTCELIHRQLLDAA